MILAAKEREFLCLATPNTLESRRKFDNSKYLTCAFVFGSHVHLFSVVKRRDKDDATRKILQMTVDGKRNRGRPKLRWRDLVRDDMARNQMTTEMAEDRGRWHVMIRAGTLRSVEADR